MPSDEPVLYEVIEAFEQIPELRLSRFYIDVKSRIVTIRGRVQSVVQREEAERIARGIVGLRALVFEVAISTPSFVRTLSHNDAAAEGFG